LSAPSGGGHHICPLTKSASSICQACSGGSASSPSVSTGAMIIACASDGGASVGSSGPKPPGPSRGTASSAKAVAPISGQSGNASKTPARNLRQQREPALAILPRAETRSSWPSRAIGQAAVKSS
jgi:hypothetical protein